MKFDALFEMKEPEFFKEAELNETFIKQVEQMGADNYDYVIASIVSVNTNNGINQSGHSQGAGKPFKCDPLLGLYKTHCIDPNMKSMAMNTREAFKGDLEIIYDQENKCDINPTEEEYRKLLEYLNEKQKQGKDIGSAIEEYSKEKGNKFLRSYQSKRDREKLTGNWLIFGKINNKNIFLYLAVGYDHSRENDSKIYQSLVDMYSESFIQELKRKGSL